MPNTLKLHRNGAAGFINWLGCICSKPHDRDFLISPKLAMRLMTEGDWLAPLCFVSRRF
jgi:hypothetical protein